MGTPSGTVTFLFTDIEGSTRRWQEDEAGMRAALARHDKILRTAIEDLGGVVFATMGDGMAAAFASASEAVSAAVDAQQALAGLLPVRMALHTGEAEVRDGDYFGTAVNRCARLAGAAHGGQLLLSGETRAMVSDGLPFSVVDLGVHRLRDLDRPMHVFQLGEARFPPLRTLDAFPGNLPLQVSSFVGRDAELARAAVALAENRVLTLTGVGGVGKTRMALQLAAQVLPRFPDGAWLVELAPVRDPAGVPDAVAGVFDVSPRFAQSVTEALVDFLRGKQLLLVMDNCEHVLEPVATFVDLLERSCPGLAILATSREGLGIAGERMLTVPSLAAPAADAGWEAVAEAAAVRLFVERAQAVKAEFVVTAENATSVAQVCRRLDGIPLAIELAAARVQAMSPAELVRRLERRFEVLAGGRRRAVERHQTLRAAIDWSFELLSPAQQRLLARLTVFAGGCTLEAAEAVCAGGGVDARAVWEEVAALVARSLVVAEDQGLATRYRLLETIRQYGEERLDEHGETAELRRRHVHYFRDLAAELVVRFLGPAQRDADLGFATERENLLRAMSWAVDTGDADLAFGLLLSVPPLNVQSGFGFRMPAEPVLALPGAEEHADYPLGVAIDAAQAAWRGDLQAAERMCDEAIAAEYRLRTHPEGQVDERVEVVRSVVAFSSGAWPEAAVHLERAAELARSIGHPVFTAADLVGAASARAIAGDTEAAVPLATEGLALARQTGVPGVILMGLGALATSLADRDPQRARALLHEGRALSATVQIENTNQVTQGVLVAARLRDRRLTLELASRCVRVLHWNGDLPQLAGILNVVAWAAAPAEPDSAAVLLGAAKRLALAAIEGRAASARQSSAASGGGTTAGLITDLRRDTTGGLVESLDDSRVRQLRTDGEVLDTDQAVALALTLIERVLALP